MTIPIFPLLIDELAGIAERDTSPNPLPGRGGEGAARSESKPHQSKDLVFPDQAAMYEENPDGITWRVKKVLAVALGGVEAAGVALPEVSDEETRRRGQEFIAGLPDSEKKRRRLAVFGANVDGKKSGEVAAAAGVSKGSVSGYLNAIEAAIECKVVRVSPRR